MHFTLRTWRKEDCPSLVKHANNIKIASNLTNKFPHPYKEEHGYAFIQFAQDESDGKKIFAIDIEGSAVGGIGLHPQHDIFCKNAELGYWLGEEYWGHGIVTEAIQKVVDYGFRHMPVERIFARPFGTNSASQRCLEKAGFRLEAKLEKTIWKNNRWEDEWIYAVRKEHVYEG